MTFRVGNYVKQTSQPGWGIGRVISIGEGEKVTIFFLRGGKRIFQDNSFDLERVDGCNPLLELAGKVDWKRADRNLYVVELNSKCLIGNDASSKLIYIGFREDCVYTSE